MRKKLAIELALPILAFGVVGALFFLKDPGEPPANHRSEPIAPFDAPVERRVIRDVTSRSPAPAAARTFRVPTAEAAAASEADPRFEMHASYKRTFGSMLSPTATADSGDKLVDAGQTTSVVQPIPVDEAEAGAATRLHKISDGDTLMKLAAEHLGSTDRYLEIYELNRDVLTNPDLLPIGKVLKIPPRERPASNAENKASMATARERNLRMVPIPKGVLGTASN